MRGKRNDLTSVDVRCDVYRAIQRCGEFMKPIAIVFRTLLALSLGLASAARAQTPPLVAAASDLRVALSEVATAFKRDTGQSIALTFGSSGNFYQQLQQGAPFQMFLSADETYALDLAKAGKTVDQGVLYAIGRLAIVAPKGSPLRVDSQLMGLRIALAHGAIAHFAIANPDHAPYGERAREALMRARLWTALEPKLVMGENVSQALQFATSGAAQGGIVAYSLVFEPAFAARADYALIPAAWHQPLRQRMVLMKSADPTTRRFYAYVQQASSRAILARYGFTLPARSR